MSQLPRLTSLVLLVGLFGACQALPGASAPEAPASLGASYANASLLGLSPTTALLTQEGEEEAASEGHGFGHRLLFYIPNRILDVFDIVRARVRLGPGIAFGVRATELADLYIGTYATVYVGLPGPRGRVMPRLPFGFESKSGLELSAADVTAEGGIGPDYGLAEIGVGFQALLIGIDVGVEPFEILDLITGLITIDIADDDL